MDVRDIALAHVYAIEKDLKLGVGLGQGGEEEGRFVVVAGMWVWQDFCESSRVFL